MKRQILTIDDDPIILELLGTILSSSGYNVRTAGNGMEALKLIDSGVEFDFVISDIKMPVLNGIEFYKRLVSKDPSVKDRFIFITGNMDRESEVFIKEQGIRCLLKPFRIDELMKYLENIKESVPRDVERRREDRIRRKTPCVIKGINCFVAPFNAITEDISINGLRIIYEGEPLPVQKVFEVELREPGEKRQLNVVWSKAIDRDISTTGFRVT